MDSLEGPEEMTVTINGADRRMTTGTTVAELAELIPGSGRGTAVARNGEVVPRSAWTTTALCAGDRVEVVKAAQGG